MSKFCHHLLTLKLLQTCMSFFQLFGTIDFHSKKITMEVNGAHKKMLKMLG